MPPCDIPRVALVADAHYHCIHSDYGVNAASPAQHRSLRSWADTRTSSRVFNESHDALHYVLTDIAKRGVRHVVLLGDYTDDGQLEATQRLVDLLTHYREQSGLAFYALPGNHDMYGPVGKHQSTRFITGPGSTVLVSSDPKVVDAERQTAVLTPGMYCQGYEQALELMRPFGFFRQADHLHWETPFGANEDLEARRYAAPSADGNVTHQLTDASYLVEPADGLWLLMIDANVFEPRNGDWQITQKKAFIDSSDAGWNSVLRNKPHLVDWISSVCRRAGQLNKQLLACSHYPVLDAFNDQQNTEHRLFGNTHIARRRPSTHVADTLAIAGLRLHFSGHMHVNGCTHHASGEQTLTDIAVPSPASFPPCYKLVDGSSDQIDVETVNIYDMPVDSMITTSYQAELQHIGQPMDAALDATSHGAFLRGQVAARVLHHHLPGQWPASIVGKLSDATVADLAVFLHAGRVDPHVHDNATLPSVEQFERLPESTLASWLTVLSPTMKPWHVTPQQLTQCPMMTLVTDWYCLRLAGDQSVQFIDAEKLGIYGYLASTFGTTTSVDETTTAGYFTLFLVALQQHLDRVVTNVP